MAPWSGRKSRLLSVSISEWGHRASAIAPETAGVIGDAHGLGDPDSLRRWGRKRARCQIGAVERGSPMVGEGGIMGGSKEGPQSGVKAPLPLRWGGKPESVRGRREVHGGGC